MQNGLPFIFVIITIMLDSIGFGLIMPVMPQLIMEVTRADLAQAAVWGGALSAIFAVMQFLCGPTVGNLSDRYGRKLILLVSLFFLAIDYAIMAVAGTLWLLFAGRILGGMTSATHSTANAFVADISRPEEKAQNFGLISAAFGFGFILGPVLGGLLGDFGARAPFWAAGMLAAVNFLFGLLVMPETVTDAIRRPFEWRRSNPFGAFAQIRRLPGMGRLIVVYFLYQVAFFVYPSVWAYFATLAFGWQPSMVGVSLAAFGGGMVISQGLLIRRIVPRLGEHRSVMLGMMLNVLVFAAYGVVTEGWQVFLLVPLSSLAGIATPAMMGIMSRSVPDNAQGELQGITSSVGAVAVILSPVVMTQTFFFFTAEGAPVHFPASPFLLSALLVAAAIPVFAGRKRLGGGRVGGPAADCEKPAEPLRG